VQTKDAYRAKGQEQLQCEQPSTFVVLIDLVAPEGRMLSDELLERSLIAVWLTR
jgi:hypothetical protein